MISGIGIIAYCKLSLVNYDAFVFIYFYTPIFRRDILWYGDVSQGLHPSVHHSFSHFSPTSFDKLSWNFAFCMSLSSYEHSIKFKCRQFPSIFVGVMPLLELRIMEIHSFPLFSLTCCDILSWNLHMTLFYCTTDQVWVSSIWVNICGSNAPFGI